MSLARSPLRSKAIGEDPERRPALREVLGQLDPQDFQVLKTLEKTEDLDAFELAGEARLSPTGVLESLTKLDNLGLVEPVSDATEDVRFKVNGRLLADLNR